MNWTGALLAVCSMQSRRTAAATDTLAPHTTPTRAKWTVPVEVDRQLKQSCSAAPLDVPMSAELAMDQCDFAVRLFAL